MTTNETPEVEQRFIIETLLEENKNINENRLYLMAIIRQLKSEFHETQLAWDAEKKSLTKGE